MDEVAQIEQAIAALEAQRETLGEEIVETSLLPLQEKLAALRAQRGGERKQVTILFARVAGVAETAAVLDAEETNMLLNALWKRLDLIVDEHGGIVDKHVGSRLMALFGAPLAHEDDPRRAVLAALAMQKAVSAFRPSGRWARRLPANLRLSLQAGINTGRVMLGQVGSTGEYTAVGDSVNLASRLEEAAEPGTILVAHDTYVHIRGQFEASAMAPLDLKGKRRPVQTYLVTEEKARAFPVAPRPVAGYEATVVGREAELEQLRQRWRRFLMRGRPELILVVGEAGIGKSRLLYEFQNWVELMPERSWLFLAEADSATADLPYALIRNMLALRFQIRDSDAPAVARQKLVDGISHHLNEDGVEKAHFIGHLAGFNFAESPFLQGVLADTRQIKVRAFHYMTQFIVAMARVQPVTMFLENGQWADEGSLQMVDHLLRSCDEPLFVVCLARPTLFDRYPDWRAETAPAGALRLDLQPLSSEESRHLIQGILHRLPTVPAPLEQLVAEKAAGNPFYIEELTKMLIDDGVIETGAGRWQVRMDRLMPNRVPSTLTGVLQARLDALTALERDVLQRAAVVGQTFWDEALASLRAGAVESEASDEALADALRALVGKELIFRQEGSAFAGTTEYRFKHAILHNVAYEGVLLRQRRAYHLAVAGWLAEAAGARAGEYSGLIADHYEQAGRLEQAAQWYDKAGRRAQDAYLPETAIGYYEKALSYLPEAARTRRLALYEGLGTMLWRQARLGDAVAAYEAMRAIAVEASDVVAEARAWNLLARARRSQGASHEALDCALEAATLALEAVEAGAGGTAAGTELARAVAMQGWCHYSLGRPQEAIGLAERALARSRALGARREEALNLTLLGVAHEALGRHEDGARFKQEALRVHEAMGNRWGVGITYNNLGENARAQADFAAALDYYERALATAREIGNRESELSCYNNMGAARVGLGQYEAALNDLLRTVQMTEGRDWFALSETYRFLAEARLGLGQQEAALAAASEALRLGMEKERLDFTGGAWFALGRVAAATDATVTVGGNGYNAAACFEESARIFAAGRMVAERARTLRAWGDYEQTRGNRRRASALHEEARALFSELGIDADIDKFDGSQS